MLSAFQLSWATDNTDATDLHRFRFPFSRSYTLPPSGSPPLGQREKVRTGTLRFPPYLLPPIQGRAGEGSAFTFPFIIRLHYP